MHKIKSKKTQTKRKHPCAFLRKISSNVQEWSSAEVSQYNPV